MPDSVNSQIIGQLASRDPQDAWEEFLREYSAQIFHVIRTYETDADLSGDCFQFICERLIEGNFRRLRKFNPDGPAKFSTWLRAVVRNLCLDWRRKRVGRRRVFRSVERLSLFDQDVFRCLYQERMSAEQCLNMLASKFPQVTPLQIAESRDRIDQQLSERQHWLLSVWAGTRELQSTDVPQDEIRVGPKLIDPNPDPETQVIAADHREKLNRELETLPSRERLLLRLRFEQELSLEQCARLMDLGNAQRADRQIKEILLKLRNNLS